MVMGMGAMGTMGTMEFRRGLGELGLLFVLLLRRDERREYGVLVFLEPSRLARHAAILDGDAIIRHLAHPQLVLERPLRRPRRRVPRLRQPR